MSGTIAEVKRFVNTYHVVVRRWINSGQAGSAELRTLLASVISTRDRILELDYDERDPEVVRLLNNLRANYLYMRDLPVGDENLESFLAHGAEMVTLGEQLWTYGKPIRLFVFHLFSDYAMVVGRWLTWSTGAGQVRNAELRTLLASVISTRDRILELDYDESDPEVARLLDTLRAAYLYTRDLPVGDENLESCLAHGAEVVTLGERLIALGKPLPAASRAPGGPGRTLHEPPREPAALHEPVPVPSDMSTIVEEEIKRLTPGRIVFNPPTDMWLASTERVEVRISRTLTDDLAAGLKGRGVPRMETIKVGTFMKVQLEGAAFHIEPLTSEEQPVPATGFTEWSWNVKPEESGVQILSLAVAVRIKLPDRGEETYYSPVLDRHIHVRVNLVHATVSFVKGNWQWIVGTLVGSGALWHFLGPKSK